MLRVGIARHIDILYPTFVIDQVAFGVFLYPLRIREHRMFIKFNLLQVGISQISAPQRYTCQIRPLQLRTGQQTIIIGQPTMLPQLMNRF